MASGRSFGVIMAGGRGERFWPVSTRELPKQFLDLTGNGTLLQQTAMRLRQIMSIEDIFVVTGTEYLEIAQTQLPNIPASNFIAEPIGRNTAPCIGLAALFIERLDPSANMLVVPADHYIPNVEEFIESATAALQMAEGSGELVTFGIRPTRPETGYGYIELGERVSTSSAFFRVGRFVEKPALMRAQEYLSSGNYLWNSGMFAWTVPAIRSEIALHLPELDNGLARIAELLPSGRWAVEFSGLPSISVDYGILERSQRVLVLPSEFAWDDVGTWTALARLHQPDEHGNVIRGPAITEQCSNVIIESKGRLVAAMGVSDLVIVETDSVVLVCSSDRAQQVRRLAERAHEILSVAQR